MQERESLVERSERAASVASFGASQCDVGMVGALLRLKATERGCCNDMSLQRGQFLGRVNADMEDAGTFEDARRVEAYRERWTANLMKAGEQAFVTFAFGRSKELQGDMP